MSKKEKRSSHPFSGLKLSEIESFAYPGIGCCEDNSGGEIKWFKLEETAEDMKALTELSFGITVDSFWPNDLSLQRTYDAPPRSVYQLDLNYRQGEIYKLLPGYDPALDHLFDWEKIYTKRIFNYIQIVEVVSLDSEGNPDRENAEWRELYVRAVGDPPAGLWSEVSNELIQEKFDFDFQSIKCLYIMNESDEVVRTKNKVSD